MNNETSQALSKDQRKELFLKMKERMTAKEIATAFGKTEAAVKMWRSSGVPSLHIEQAQAIIAGPPAEKTKRRRSPNKNPSKISFEHFSIPASNGKTVIIVTTDHDLVMKMAGLS